MSDKDTGRPASSEGPSAGEAWQQAGEHFKALGETLASAFRQAWESEETRRHVTGLRDGLAEMVNELGEAIKEATESPEGQKVRSGAEKVAQSAERAGRETAEAARWQVLSALREVNAELQRIIANMQEGGSSEGRAAEAEDDEQ